MNFKESETLELKKSTSELKEAVISIVAMLNKHQRCELYFGIKNDGVVVGQGVTEKTVRDISKAIADNIEPRVYPVIAQVEIEEKTCIRVECHGKEVPYFAYGRAYIRTADEDRQLSAKELEGLFIKKNKEKLRWDMEVCKDAKFSDLGTKKLKDFLAASGLKYDTVENSLEKLKLTVDGKLRNAAVMLFARKPQAFFPNVRLRCAVFGTTDTSFTIDMKDYEGDLFFLIEKAEEYILQNIHIGMRLEGLRRIDVPEIDKEALREAIINAFCHRDYREYDSVNIAVFKDRVEVRSPGLLYGGLTIDAIRKKMISERRNELIAELFHRIHFIEKWGRGISLILSREPETEFSEVGTHFIATFRRKHINIPLEIARDKTGEKTTQKTIQKTTQKILDMITGNPGITRKELASSIGISESGIKFHLTNLRKKGILRRIGPDKGGYWEISSGM